LKKIKLVPLLKILVLVRACYLIYRIVLRLGPANILAAARGADPFWLLAGLGAIAVRFLLWGFKWRIVLRRDQDVGYVTATKDIMAACFLNLITPTAKIGGGFFRAFAVRKRSGLPLSEAYGLVFSDQATFFTGKLLLFGGMLYYAVLLVPALGLRRWYLAPGLLFFVPALLLLTCRGPLLQRVQRSFWGDGLQRRVSALFRRDSTRNRPGFMGRLLAPLLAHGTNREIFFFDILLSALSFGIFCASNAMVLRALGATAPLATVTLAMMLGYLFGSVLGFMGGIGVTELFLIELFTRAGIDAEIATTGTLLHRALFYLFLILVGGPAAWRAGWHFGAPVTPAESADDASTPE